MKPAHISFQAKTNLTRIYDFLKDSVTSFRIKGKAVGSANTKLDVFAVSKQLLKIDELRALMRQKGFRVKAMATHLGLDVRTLERRFEDQFRMTPKAWITRERMSFALPLLAEGLSNKQIATSLNYTCESNFCRDFKRCFGDTPQGFAQAIRQI